MRMWWKSWIEHLLNLRVFFKHFCDLQSVWRSSLYSNFKSFWASQSNPGIEWSDHGSHWFDIQIKFIVKFPAVEDNGTSHYIWMSTDVFGDWVHNDICSKSKWVLKNRRHKCVVDNEKSALFFADVSNSFDVWALECGVCWRLNPHQFGILLECSSNLLEIWHVGHWPFLSRVWSVDLSQVSLGTSVDVINAK